MLQKGAWLNRPLDEDLGERQILADKLLTLPAGYDRKKHITFINPLK